MFDVLKRHEELIAGVGKLVDMLGPLTAQLEKAVFAISKADELTDGDSDTFTITNDNPTMIAPARPTRRNFTAQIEGAGTNIRVSPSKRRLTTNRGHLVTPTDQFEDDAHTGEWWAIATTAGPARVNTTDVFKVDRRAIE